MKADEIAVLESATELHERAQSLRKLTDELAGKVERLAAVIQELLDSAADESTREKVREALRKHE